MQINKPSNMRHTKTSEKAGNYSLHEVFDKQPNIPIFSTATLITDNTNRNNNNFINKYNTRKH